MTDLSYKQYRIARGRFAPTPSGPLHFGSLVAALGSFLDARSRGGAWLVRIEDIDTPRNAPGAVDEIQRQLEAFGLHWDEPITYQRSNIARYVAALEQMKSAHDVFACVCSRKEIADSSLRGIEGPIYPGTCRNGLLAGRSAEKCAWRVRVPAADIAFVDLVQGEQHQNLATQLGDFVVQRGDGLFAYQLAVVVDDAAQGITHVVRGADLLLSTPRQILLQRLLGLPTPAYAHLPVAVNANGEKLSKQTYAAAIDPRSAPQLLSAALDFLHHSPPPALRGAPPRQLLEWAIAAWTLTRVPRTLSAHANAE